MSSHTIIRTLAAALAVSALAAPTALARPADPVSSYTRDSGGPSQRVHDLRRLNAGNDIHTAATSTYTPGYTPGEIRGRDAYYSPSSQAALAQERSYSSYGPPAVAQHAARVADTDGVPWTTIALGLAGACLLLGAAVATAGRTRLRTRRARIAA